MVNKNPAILTLLWPKLFDGDVVFPEEEVRNNYSGYGFDDGDGYGNSIFESYLSGDGFSHSRV